MPEYIDRGIMKWQPFDALVGYHDMIKEMVYLKNKRQKPVLFEDKLEEINRTIQLAMSSQLPVRITYYDDGYIYYQSGYIAKVDLYTKIICLKPKNDLMMEDILELEIIESL